jgi:hypothetical protein
MDGVELTSSFEGDAKIRPRAYCRESAQTGESVDEERGLAPRALLNAHRAARPNQAGGHIRTRRAADMPSRSEGRHGVGTGFPRRARRRAECRRAEGAVANLTRRGQEMVRKRAVLVKGLHPIAWRERALCWARVSRPRPPRDRRSPSPMRRGGHGRWETFGRGPGEVGRPAPNGCRALGLLTALTRMVAFFQAVPDEAIVAALSRQFVAVVRWICLRPSLSCSPPLTPPSQGGERIVSTSQGEGRPLWISSAVSGMF